MAHDPHDSEKEVVSAWHLYFSYCRYCFSNQAGFIILSFLIFLANWWIFLWSDPELQNLNLQGLFLVLNTPSNRSRWIFEIFETFILNHFLKSWNNFPSGLSSFSLTRNTYLFRGVRRYLKNEFAREPYPFQFSNRPLSYISCRQVEVLQCFL